MNRIDDSCIGGAVKKTTVLERVVNEMIAKNEMQTEIISEAASICYDIIQKVGHLYSFVQSDQSVGVQRKESDDNKQPVAPNFVGVLERVTDQIGGNTSSIISLVNQLRDIRDNLEQIV